MRTITSRGTAAVATLILGLCALTLLGQLTGCSDTNPLVTNERDYEARAAFSYAIAAGDQSGFRIENINGPINIGTTTRDTVVIEGERIVESTSLEDAEDHLSDVRIEFSTATDELVVRTVQPDDSSKRSYEVEYDVRIPATWSVYADNINGTVAVDSISGAVTVDLTNGVILLNEITGNTKADLVNGVLTARIILQPEGSCSLTAINGTLGLSIPRQTSAILSASTINGSINSAGLNFTDLTTTPTTLSGTLGAGNGTIEVRMTNGTVGITGF